MIKFSIIGSGFVGNILHAQTNCKTFDRDSISEFTKLRHDVIVIAAPTGNRLQVCRDPQQDLRDCDDIIDLIANCNYNSLVHVSTVDIYSERKSHSADTTQVKPHSAYGHNRWYLEQKLQQLTNCHTIRLPSLIDNSVKKNILFDIKNMIWLEKIHIQSRIQWYPLIRLRRDIEHVITTQRRYENFTSEPISNMDIVKRYKPNLVPLLEKNTCTPVDYDVKSSDGGYHVSTNEIWASMDRYFGHDIVG